MAVRADGPCPYEKTKNSPKLPPNPIRPGRGDPVGRPLVSWQINLILSCSQKTINNYVILNGAELREESRIFHPRW